MDAKISKADVQQVRQLQLKKYRDERHLFVAEGQKCVEQLQGAFRLELLANSENATILQLNQMSSLKTPQGVVAVFHQPSYSIPAPDPNRLYIALDGIQDPGNLGTIIRTADWFGIHDILCSKDTADCFSPKVVQATMGSLSRIRVHYIELPIWLQQFATMGGKVYGTLLDGPNMYAPDAIPNAQNGVIVMGNEGNGLSNEVRATITHPLRIPSYPPNCPTAESLNVAIATAIIIAHFRELNSH